MALIVPFAVNADPRMEVNDNFCHFMHDYINDDNETFVAGANPVISVAQDQTSANGYCLVKRKLLKEQINHDYKVNLTSDNSDETCAMVESNGTQYNSDTWTSSITVTPIYKYKRVYVKKGDDDDDDDRKKVIKKIDTGYVNVVYELSCLDGAQ